MFSVSGVKTCCFGYITCRAAANRGGSWLFRVFLCFWSCTCLKKGCDEYGRLRRGVESISVEGLTNDPRACPRRVSSPISYSATIGAESVFSNNRNPASKAMLSMCFSLRSNMSLRALKDMLSYWRSQGALTFCSFLLKYES